MPLTIDQWGADVTGRAVRNSNPNQPIAQCTELWRDFLERVVGVDVYRVGFAPDGHAYSYYTLFGAAGPSNNNTLAPQHLDRIPVASGGRRGDAVIWDKNISGVTFGDGHIAVLDKDNGDGTLEVWSQNHAGSVGSTEYRAWPARGVLGFLRPKALTGTNPTPTPEEALDMAFLPNLFVNKTSSGSYGLGIAVFANGLVKATPKSQFDAYKMWGSPVKDITVDGHWEFLQQSAADVRAAN